MNSVEKREIYCDQFLPTVSWFPSLPLGTQSASHLSSSQSQAMPSTLHLSEDGLPSLTCLPLPCLSCSFGTSLFRRIQASSNRSDTRNPDNEASFEAPELFRQEELHTVHGLRQGIHTVGMQFAVHRHSVYRDGQTVQGISSQRNYHQGNHKCVDNSTTSFQYALTSAQKTPRGPEGPIFRMHYMVNSNHHDFEIGFEKHVYSTGIRWRWGSVTKLDCWEIPSHGPVPDDNLHTKVIS